MKKVSICLFLQILVLFSLSLASDTTKKADSLIALHKYSSAFELLNQADKMDIDREIVFKKMDVALNYFVMSLNHAMFSFLDIGPKEDIMSYRGKQGSSEMFVFPIDSILLRLLIKYPDDGKIYKRLGDFYQDVLNRYGGRWIVSDDSLNTNIISYYNQAEKKNSLDYKGFDNLGVAYFQRENLEEAEKCFRASIKMNSQNPDSPYNLAYLYSIKRKYKEAIPFAQKAFELYSTRSLKSDAGRLCATCFNGSDDFINALKYLRLTDKFDPNNYYVYRNIMWTFLKMKSLDSAITSSVRFFDLGPSNPRLTQDILADYKEAGLSDEIPKVFRVLMGNYRNDPEASGNILFHFSQYYQDRSDYSLGLAYLDSAETKFRICLPDTNYVFKVINSRRNTLQRK
jgi:tetratricopeptide (TPR) repeat protein